MKRAVSITLAVILMVSLVTTACATTKTELFDSLKAFAVGEMKTLRDKCKSSAGDVKDSMVVALYSYYRMYVSMSDAKIAELAMDFGTFGDMLIERNTFRTAAVTLDIINDEWLKWLKGESSTEEILRVLFAFVDGIIQAETESK